MTQMSIHIFIASRMHLSIDLYFPPSTEVGKKGLPPSSYSESKVSGAWEQREADKDSRSA